MSVLFVLTTSISVKQLIILLPFPLKQSCSYFRYTIHILNSVLRYTIHVLISAIRKFTIHVLISAFRKFTIQVLISASVILAITLFLSLQSHSYFDFAYPFNFKNSIQFIHFKYYHFTSSPKEKKEKKSYSFHLVIFFKSCCQSEIFMLHLLTI